MERDIGSLEPGKLADLVILDGNPLADIRQSDTIAQVMLNGRLYAQPTMNEVGRRAKPRQPFFFDGIDGAAVPVKAQGHAEEDGISETFD
jgi:adenine deaminase